MAATRRAALLSVAMTTILAGTASAVLDNRTGQVTVFWGRHRDEGSLREACDSGMYTAVVMSFLTVGGGRGGHGHDHDPDLSGYPLAGVGDDIKRCQSAGVRVSLSVRAGGSSHAISNRSAALGLADHLWNAYLGGSRQGVRRPFGGAVLDGVDLFLEPGTPVGSYAVLAREVAKRGGSGTAGTKAVLLTATVPSCGLVRRGAGNGKDNVLATGVFERIHVRFYDDGGDKAGCGEYSEEDWDRWTAAYPSTRIFLGLPAAPEASKEGYLYQKTLYYGVLPVVQVAPNYGGVMLWDRYYDKLSSYSSYVKRWA